ncbi:MAG: type III-A CRISPR-associated protein Cas10/Csm1, partial [Armatimonadetes bacterium]|nr:type III-A CRISPR-associated protein Cas10/Csm1 [Armatimonadota bacterium]
MTREERTVTLGALLHDIGKYLQRGEFRGMVSGQHPAVGADFIRAFGEHWGQCADPALLETLVQHHHESDSFKEGLRVDDIGDPHARALARLVSRADNLASSERSERASGYRDFRVTALSPALGRVKLTHPDALPESHLPHADFGSLRFEPPIFPVAGRITGAEDVTDHIRSFGQAFDRLRAQLKWKDFDCVFTHLYSLLQRFAACIASDTQSDRPDISLFDHLRMTCAIAICLYRYHSARGALSDEAIKTAPPDQARCALLVGDLSGIQDYLFDIATVGPGGVARRLRARSFALQMLSEVASQKALCDFDLPVANIVMASGGKFYALLPNLEETAAKIEALQGECDRWTLRRYHGALTLNLAWTPMTDHEFGAGGRESGFGPALARLHSALSRRKQRRLSGAILGEGGWLEPQFVREPFGESETDCKSCHRFPARLKSDPGENDPDLCEICHQDAALGRLLPSARYVGLYNHTDQGIADCFGWGFAAAQEADKLPDCRVLVMRLNDGDLSETGDIPSTFRFIANHAPTGPEGAPLTFDEIAAAGRGENAGERGGLLAVIKADVDYLGQVFQEGLRRDSPSGYDTPSRIAALSRQMDGFFSAWLQWLFQNEYPHTYTIYSGGDDLLVVAPRSDALPMLRRLHQAFTRFAANPDITLSAGVSLVKSRLPLAHTAKTADEALEKAKENGRNRLCLLGQIVRWEDLPIIAEAAKLMEEADPPSSMLYRLAYFGKLWREWKSEQTTSALRFQPMLAYTISRNFKTDSPLFSWASRLVGFSVNDSECKEAKIMDYLGVIARWALLERREMRDG